MTDRLSSYKNAGVSTEGLRKSRLDQTVSIRREKRDEVMAKRRNLQITPSEEAIASRVTVSDIHDLLDKLRTGDPAMKRDAALKARKLLSFDKNPPIDELLQAGVAPLLVGCLQSGDPVTRIEACWALTNIAGGNYLQTNAIVEAGVLDNMLGLFESDNVDLCEQAVWLLGNIIGECVPLRDLCIQKGLLAAMCKFLDPALPLGFVRTVAWVFLNFCRGPSTLSNDAVHTLLTVASFFLSCSDVQVLQEAVWAVSYLTDGGVELIQKVIDFGMVKRVIPLLAYFDTRVQMPTLRMVGNIVTGTDDQTQVVLDSGALSYMPSLLTHRKPKINAEALWFLSNIAAGNEVQVQTIIDATLLPYVIHLLENGDSKSKKEAGWTISNITVTGTTEQIMYMVQKGVISPMCGILKNPDPSIVVIVLDGILNILKKAGAKEEEVCLMIEECGGLDTIEELENHENEQIYSLAYEIVANHFPCDKDEDYAFNLQKDEEDGADKLAIDRMEDVPKGGFAFD